MAKKVLKRNVEVLDLIKKNILIGMGTFKSSLPMIQKMEDKDINGKYKYKTWLRRIYI